MAAALHDPIREHMSGIRRLHLVVHSLGGAVGLRLAEQDDLPLASFINVEGNLVAADCGLLSRRTAEMDPKQFRTEKFAKLKARARESEDPVVRAWAGWLDACSADALHASARSLVAWSDSGRLLGIFRALRVPKLYAYGTESANPEVLAHLDGAPKREIAGSGHFVMLDRPAALAAAIAEVIAQTRSRAAPALKR